VNVMHNTKPAWSICHMIRTNKISHCLIEQSKQSLFKSMGHHQRQKNYLHFSGRTH
jgi:hypothetical protein